MDESAYGMRQVYGVGKSGQIGYFKPLCGSFSYKLASQVADDAEGNVQLDLSFDSTMPLRYPKQINETATIIHRKKGLLAEFTKIILIIHFWTEIRFR